MGTIVWNGSTPTCTQHRTTCKISLTSKESKPADPRVYILELLHEIYNSCSKTTYFLVYSGPKYTKSTISKFKIYCIFLIFRIFVNNRKTFLAKFSAKTGKWCKFYSWKLVDCTSYLKKNLFAWGDSHPPQTPQSGFAFGAAAQALVMHSRC